MKTIEQVKEYIRQRINDLNEFWEKQHCRESELLINELDALFVWLESDDE